ncbi:MAG: AraC family transcriptional regulator [Pseudomonadota bacterium]
MQKLIDTAKKVARDNGSLPFSVYCSLKEQRMLNVPVIKPLLIAVLSGNKSLGADDELLCPAGSFVFLSNTPTIAMRNIPSDSEYFALLIEFDYSDFECLEHRSYETTTYFQGAIKSRLIFTLQQFVEWSAFSSPELWHIRRKEILQVIASLGFEQVGSVMKPPTLSHKIHTIISSDLASDLDAGVISSMLAMSESTLRRKLSAEGDKFQDIKDRVKLGHGLHLVQTSVHSIGHIAAVCGYSSQSRFTDKFKQLFNITPTELRKTKMIGSSE